MFARFRWIHHLVPSRWLAILLCCVTAFLMPAVTRAEIVALGSFAHSDYERNDADTSNIIAAAVQSGLDASGRWKFVERGETDRIFAELGLSRRGLVSADTAARVGKLIKADLLVSGTFFTPKDATAYVILECNELVRAEPVRQVRIELGPILEQGHLAVPAPEDLKRIVAASNDLLAAAVAQLTAQRGRTILKLLFLTNQTDDPAFNGIERLLGTGLEQAAATGGTHRMLRLDRPEISTQESELALLGLVEADPSAWAHVADYYLWGSVKLAHGSLTVSVTLWNGRQAPQELTETGAPDQVTAITHTLVDKLLAAATPPDRKTASGDLEAAQRQKIALLLTQQAETVRVQQTKSKQPKETGPAAVAEQRRLLVAATFFSPAEKQCWYQLLNVRLADNARTYKLPDLLRQIGNLEYGLEVADRFLVSADGKIDPSILLGLTTATNQYARDRFSGLMSDFDYFHEDFADIFAGRNLLALQANVTASYRRHLTQLAAQLAHAAPGQNDAYRRAAEFVLLTALSHPFTPAERKNLIDTLCSRLKVAIFVHRAWYPGGERPVQLDALLRDYYLDLHQIAVADSLNVLTPAELAEALAAAAPAGSPGGETLQSIQIGDDQIARIKQSAPGGVPSASQQKFIEQRQPQIAAQRAAYAALQIRAAAFLESHSEGHSRVPADFAPLLKGPVHTEVTTFNPPLESYPLAVKARQSKWLRDLAVQRASDGYPAGVLDRLRTQADAIDREATAAPQEAAQPEPAQWNGRKPTFLDPRQAAFLLSTMATQGDLPSLQALLDRGAPVEAAGAALAEAIHKEQWPTAYFLLSRGYDPSAPWPDMEIRREPLGWRDHPGRVALAEAAIAGRTDLVDALLAKGVRFTAKSDSGAYAVMELAKSRRLAVLRQVLAAKARPDNHLQNALEPLYYAIREHDLEVLQALLGAGADPTRLIGHTVTMSAGLNGSNQWEKFNDGLLGDKSVSYCARENWLEGAQALLSQAPANLREYLVKEQPHREATLPAVRAVFVRAELEASPSAAAHRAGIDLFTAIAAGDQTGFAAALARPESRQIRGLRSETALMFACDEKAWSMARQLLAAGASLTEFDNIGSTPLCYAARNGGIELVEAMVRKGADLNLVSKNANRPLDQAIMEGRNSAMALKLLALGATYAPHPKKPGVIPLFQATTANLPDVVHELVRLGSDPRQTADSYTVLFPAARSNNPELIQYYMDLKCDLNQRSDDKWTPLMSAVRWGAAASVEKLLELGLRDPNAAALAVRMVKDLEPADRPVPADLRRLHYRPDYRRCLELMEEFGQIAGSREAQNAIFWHSPHTIPEIEGFLAQGGDLNVRNSQTPLQTAISLNDLAKVAYLLGKGANPNLVGTERISPPPLRLALEQPAMVELLLKYGALPNATTHDSYPTTMLALACLNPRVPVETIRLLMRYGADPDIDARFMLARYRDAKNDPRGLAQIEAALNGK